MGKALKDKGFEIAGAAKAMGMHSIMFDDPEPIGKNRPNPQDDAIIEQMVVNIYQRLSNNSLIPLPLDALDYQPEDIAVKNKEAMTQACKVTQRIRASMPIAGRGFCPGRKDRWKIWPGTSSALHSPRSG
ncbi:hypothetical protein ACFL0M_08660 [Thermodesulfobacteriota bacterium]